MKHKIILYTAGEAGLFSWLHTSTRKLAQALKSSQQTISRQLISLESQCFIDREPTTGGIKIRLTDKSRRMLRDEFSVLQKVFEAPNFLEGRVFKGFGEGGYYVKIYESKIKSLLGFKPYPGTLNLSAPADDVNLFLMRLDSKSIPSFKAKDREFGSARIYPIRIFGKKAAILRPERTNYDSSIVEIVSGDCLREKMKLKDGDILKLEVG